MWDVLSCPFNKPRILSNRARRENSSQLASREKNLLKCYVQGRFTPCFGLVYVYVCVCVRAHALTCMHVHKCARVHVCIPPLSLPIAVLQDEILNCTRHLRQGNQPLHHWRYREQGDRKRMEEHRRGSHILLPLNLPQSNKPHVSGARGLLCAWTAEWGSPQQKWRLTLEEAQGCPQISGILGKTGREEGSRRSWVGRETSFHTQDPPKSVNAQTYLTNSPTSLLCGFWDVPLLLGAAHARQGLRSWEDPTVTWLGPAADPCRSISPGSGKRGCSLSALSDIRGVPRSSVPCPLHKCNFPKCQEESITDNTLCVSLTQ